MEQQKDLVDKISRVHNDLRKNWRESEETWESVWKKHTQNEGVLKEYAESMHKLATEVWDGRNSSGSRNMDDKKGPPRVRIKCRLEWVNRRSLEYFQSIVKGRKLEMLDVGSCYNPFQKYEEFYDITAIDLCPANGCEGNVLKCDFLQLEVGNERRGGKDQKNGLEALTQESFDIIVFSFFLEYLPDRKQRLDSCKKARDLLKPGGILFVLRPDSNSDGPNSINTKLVKGLKVGNAMIGLRRIYLEKLEHLWCMGFIKMTSEETTAFMESSGFTRDVRTVEKTLGKESVTTRIEKLYGISQDFINYNATDMITAERSLPPKALPELFEELPGLFEEAS